MGQQQYIDLFNQNKNIFIISPAGSGKSNFVLNHLSTQYNNILYLCDTTNLTIQTKNELENIPHHNIKTVDTYRGFASVVKNNTNNIIADYDLVICDEIHSLIEYISFGDKGGYLAILLHELLKLHTNTKVLFMSATPSYLNKLKFKYPSSDANFEQIDLSIEPEIIRYTELFTGYLNHLNQIKPSLNQGMTGFKYKGMKVLIYVQQIEHMLRVQEDCLDLNLMPVCIWSPNNLNHPMSVEQLNVRNHLLQTGELLPPYNILIINKATETGINITDKAFELAIVHSKNDTEQIQARNRVRKDINLLIVKTDDETLLNDSYAFKINLPESLLDVWLSKEQIEGIIDQYKLKDSIRRKLSVNALVKNSNRYGIEINKSTKLIDNKRTVVYKINYIKPQK
jgi:hypothetical protein